MSEPHCSCCQNLDAQLRAAVGENVKLRKRVADVTGHLLKIMDGSWQYVHQRCTINSVLQHWKEAREFCGKVPE